MVMDLQFEVFGITRMDPIHSLCKRCDSTTWNMSPALIYSFAISTISQNSFSVIEEVNDNVDCIAFTSATSPCSTSSLYTRILSYTSS